MTTTSIPICDLRALRDGSAREQARLVLDIGAAARDTGFFAIVNHGIPEFLSERAFAAAERFFALPPAEKERVAMDRTPYYRGYRGPAAQRSGSGLPDDLKESFNIGRDLAADDPDIVAGAPFVGVNQWPDLPGFRETAMTYFRAMSSLAVLVQRAFALDLSMSPDFFVPRCDRPLTTLRFMRHLPDAHPGHFNDVLYGGGAHSDWGIFSLLALDGVGGLEIGSADGLWTAVEPVSDALICNVGDCLMRWSNDRYQSRPYRVVNRADRPGHAISFSADPNPDTLIACLPTCLEEDEPAKYPPISYAEYQRERFASKAVTLAG